MLKNLYVYDSITCFCPSTFNYKYALHSRRPLNINANLLADQNAETHLISNKSTLLRNCFSHFQDGGRRLQRRVRPEAEGGAVTAAAGGGGGHGNQVT